MTRPRLQAPRLRLRIPPARAGSVAKCIGVPITDRAQGMEILRRPAQGGPRPCRRLVDRPPAARDPARGVRHRHGRACGRRAARQFSRRSARVGRRHLRAASSAHSDSLCGRRQPRRPHRRLALRPSHRGLRAPTGHGAPRGLDAHRRPHRRARLRPRHDRPAARNLHGFHRQRHGRDDRRSRVRRDPRQIRVVGAHRARGRVAGDALAATRERNLARPQHRRGAWRATGCRLRLPAGGGPAREQGTAAVRPGPVDDRPFHRQTHSLARASVRSHASARASRRLEHAPGRLRERPGVLATGERRRPWPHQSRGSRGLRAERRRRVDDRVRRIQLGARRSRCPRRRGAAARAGHASRRRAAFWQPPRGRDACARDSSPRCQLRVPSRLARAGSLRSLDSRRLVARHRWAERRRQDHHRQAAVPVVRSAVGRESPRFLPRCRRCGGCASWAIATSRA